MQAEVTDSDFVNKALPVGSIDSIASHFHKLQASLSKHILSNVVKPTMIKNVLFSQYPDKNAKAKWWLLNPSF